jgi:hypothetical protein
MVRRIAVLLALGAAFVVAGCAYGTPATLTADQEHARTAFIEDHGDFSDRDLARLCPGMYPRDFLTNDDDWPAGKSRSGDMTARQIDAARTKDAAAVRAAGCDVFPE